jgi:ATP synthase F1 gamma subunit
MQSTKAVNSEIDTLESLKTIIESYEEISATRMRRVKKSVLQNRDFLEGLNDVYAIVEGAYNNYSKKITNSAPKNNGKTVTILLSANTGLYGELVKNVFDMFMSEVKNNEHDLVLVGRIGRKLYEDGKYTYPYKYFDFSDSGTDNANLINILGYVLQYKDIIVYHGLFKNILQQIPSKTFVTGKAEKYGKTETKEQPKYYFIFEPSAEVIAKFFEDQLLAAMFEQTVNESSLSKFASRMVNLDFASENISHKLTSTSFEARKLKHRKMNSTQLSALSGISLWG